MTHDPTDAERGVPAQFERNRYFHGKLMTARDMAAEQDYHRRRLAALARGVLGTGVVTGLEVTDAEERDGTLRVGVAPGVALDAAGRPVVVPSGTGPVTVRRPGSDAPFAADETAVGEAVALTLRYDACATERVPAPGNEHASGDGGEYGRVVETFLVEAEPVETDADGDPLPAKPVPEVPLPGPDAAPDEAGRRLAAEAFDRSPAETPLVLATAEKTDDGVWSVGGAPRPLVYPNDLVYAAVATHATDRENPHGVDVGQVDGAVASVGGVDPSPDGDVAVRSESDAIDVTAADDALVFDSDALRAVVVDGAGTVHGDAGGRVRFDSPDGSVTISTDGDGVGFGTDALRSLAVEGAGAVEGDDDGRVTLHSPDGSVAITANEAGDSVGFSVDVEVDADLEGVLRELGGLDDHGGSIGFTSSNGSVAVEPFEDEPDTLDVRVTQRFLEEFRERLLEELAEDEEEEGPHIPIGEIRDGIRTDLEATFADRFEELGRTNETLSEQVSRLSVSETDPTRTPVTALEGFDLSNANDLREVGVVTVADLAEADVETLRRVSGVGEATANDWRATARERINR